MKFVKLLKIMNNKTTKYQKSPQTNPFKNPLKSYTIVWVEDSESNYNGK